MENMGLLDWLPSRRRLAREREEAQRDSAETAIHEQRARRDIRDAYKLANDLAQLRAENHFADRMREAYRGERRA